MRPYSLPLIAFVALAAVPVCLLAGESPVQIKAEDVQRDLVLEAKLTSPKQVMPGEPVMVETRIVNRSKTVSYPVVRPGDGSESGWREPHVYYTATVNTGDGEWREIPKQGLGRCGMYDANWQDEVTTLDPGDSLDMQDWLPQPGYVLDFQQAGTVRLVAHYRFSAGVIGKGRKGLEGTAPDGLGGMAGVEAFELASEPVEFTVVRPIDLDVKVRGPVAAGKLVRVSDLLHVKLVNRDLARFELGQHAVSLMVKPGAVRLTKRERVPPHGALETTTLTRGDYVTLLGEGFASGRDEEIAFAGAGEVQVAIQFTLSSGWPRLRSEWVTLTVTE